LLCVALVAGALADTDETAISEDPPLPEAEYITETAIQPVSGAETTQKDPFKPYDIGEGVTPIAYEELSPAEQAVIDRGRNVAGWQQIHSAYGAAAKELGATARFQAAARQLGIPDVALQGVVP
jgi:hypothetical protein